MQSHRRDAGNPLLRFVYLCEDNRRQPPVQERLDKWWTKIRLWSEDARNDCETILVPSQKRIVMLAEIYD